MVNRSMWLPKILIGVMLLVLVGFGYLVFDPTGVHQVNRDRLRHQHLVEIADVISANIAWSGNRLTTGITTDWVQLGTATDACQVMTDQCQVTQANCLNLQPLLADPLTTLPSDPLIGSVQRSGYVIRFVQPNIVEIKSCAGEKEEIIRTTSYPGIFYETESEQ